MPGHSLTKRTVGRQSVSPDADGRSRMEWSSLPRGGPQTFPEPELVAQYRFSADLKRRLLRSLATNTVSSFCLPEPASRSNAFALRTRAAKVGAGAGYRPSGGKMWITNSIKADFLSQLG
ncbi:hypothetical protein DL764_008937 [Monosporascus ibericus]|uniref:Acyl-CoA oxidase/dehydrogenase middle domain-containing protein n=1 Tax=Monosporascus ibericus TaxID=155417 RepID=A0A4Q4SW80_9PEZI|nr:hypothetical protein DL764_008937 [Monosporascus ibericus]